jgi:transcriptional regulator with XRE-family HTH domain
MNPEWFGGRLRELREAAGWTQQRLAEVAGMKLGGVRNLEQGRRSPAWETVLALAQALGVDCTAFTKEPAAREPKPGRPRKAEPDQAEDKPRKAPGKPATGRTRGKVAEGPSGTKKGGKSKK